MFTIKFIGKGSTPDATVCCVRYDTTNNADRIVEADAPHYWVEVFRGLDGEPSKASSFPVGGRHENGYHVAYVENQAGKTIDRIGSMPPMPSRLEDIPECNATNSFATGRK